MGTNYYIKRKDKETGQLVDYMHIGKQSCGHVFIWNKEFLDWAQIVENNSSLDQMYDISVAIGRYLERHGQNIYTEDDQNLTVVEFLVGIFLTSTRDRLQADAINGFQYIDGEFN